MDDRKLMDITSEAGNWYAVITADILYSKELSARQKLLAAVVSNLSNRRGFCYAKNAYFCELMDISERTLQRDLTVLIDGGFIEREVVVYNDSTIRILKPKGVTPMTGGGDVGDAWGVTPMTGSNNKENNKENREGAAEKFDPKPYDPDEFKTDNLTLTPLTDEELRFVTERLERQGLYIPYDDLKYHERACRLYYESEGRPVNLSGKLVAWVARDKEKHPITNPRSTARRKWNDNTTGGGNAKHTKSDELTDSYQVEYKRLK